MSNRDKSWWENWLFVKWYRARTSRDYQEAETLMRRREGLQKGTLHVETLEEVYRFKLTEEEE